MDKSRIARVIYVVFFTIFSRARARVHAQKTRIAKNKRGKSDHYRVAPVTRGLFKLCMKNHFAPWLFVCFCYPRIYGTYLFTLILECLLFFCYDIPCPFPDVHQSVCTINPSCFLPTCRAADAFILMGSPRPWSVPPFFLWAIKRLDAAKRESFQATAVTSISSSSPSFPPPCRPPSKRGREGVIFSICQGTTKVRTPRVSKVLCSRDRVRIGVSWVSRTLRSRQNARSICCRPINGRTTNNVSHKLFYFIFSFPS